MDRGTLRRGPTPGLVIALSAASWVATAQQPTTVPFNEAVSVRITHDGAWLNYASGEREMAEIEDLVAAFDPQDDEEEEDTDRVWYWYEHQINTPRAPEGWTFFSPVVDEPMGLHVVLTDMGGRLGRAIVTERDTGEAVGELQADDTGAEIDGRVDVSPGHEAFDIEVRDRADQCMLLLGANNPRVEEVLPVACRDGWLPNRGADHEMCSLADTKCPGRLEDTFSLEGQVSTQQRVCDSTFGCPVPTQFENDSPEPMPIVPNRALLDRQVLRDSTQDWEPVGLPPRAVEQVRDALAAVRTQLAGGVSAVEPYVAPPFSRGTCHWWVQLVGDLRAVIYYPYRGRRRDREEMAAFLQRMGDSFGAAGGRGSVVPCQAIADAERARWDPWREQWCAIWTPRPVGDIWTLIVKQHGGSQARPLRGITAPVTFELWSDIAPPDGTAGYVAGRGQVDFTEAWTTPEPPRNAGPGLEFTPDGPGGGECTVELGKGWRWKATARPDSHPHYSPVDSVTFDHNGPATKRFDVKLVSLLSLVVKTVDDRGEAVGTVVDLDVAREDRWLGWAQGETQGQGGRQAWSPHQPLDPGRYRVRAADAARGPRDWSEWHEFTVLPGLEQTVTIAVPTRAAAAAP